MAIAFDTSGNSVGTTTSCTIDITSAAVGAWCYAYFNVRGGGSAVTPTTPTGWTLIGSVRDETTGFTNQALYRRKKVAGDTTFTLSYSPSNHAVTVWGTYTGVDPFTPDDGVGTWLAHTASTTSYATAALTNQFVNGWAVGFFGAASSTLTRTFTAAAGMTERQDASNASNTWSPTELADSNGVVTVASHTYTAVLSSAESHGGCALIYLKPAVSLAALTYIDHGITDNGTLSIRVNYPVAILKNDLLIARIGAHPDTTTITTFAGWTAITNGSGTGGTGSQAADTGPVKTALYYKIADGTESGNNDWTTSGLSCAISYMHQFRSRYFNGLYRLTASNGSDNTGGATWSVTGGQTLTCVPDDICLVCETHPDGVNNTAWSAESLTGCGTFAITGPEAKAGTTAGNDCVERDQIFTCTAGGSGAPVHAATIAATNTNAAGAGVILQVQAIPSDPLMINQEALVRASFW